jgi:hypothetical protein
MDTQKNQGTNVTLGSGGGGGSDLHAIQVWLISSFSNISNALVSVFPGSKFHTSTFSLCPHALTTVIQNIYLLP